MTHSFKTSPVVCSNEITFNVEDGVITKVYFDGGCPGSLTAVSALVIGMAPEDAVKKLSGIKCANKPTSCPDQLASAIKEYLAAK